MGLWTNGGWFWNFQWRRPLRAWEDDKMQQMLEAIKHIMPSQEAEDTWSWRMDKKGKYTTRSAYEELASKEENNLMEHKKLWGAKVPSKVSAFSWQLLLDRIPTKYVLRKTCTEVFRQHSWHKGPKILRKSWNILWFALVWTIWLSRNETVFQHKKHDDDKLLQLVQIRSFHWVRILLNLENLSLMEWISNPVRCMTNTK
ncbi:hypothetical protein SLEP1_g21329 [Rubroshorea leprosula]|uniref:Reverse transcriptase zinc-binding domain-containing protein n=1 Tax=Rubroshorea leprosula TaxID=152421 RepID=A0AAV5JG53_9ROSI|nr:hypothetical protein SLEP1_g21329 [Rubroshorea leprosula]